MFDRYLITTTITITTTMIYQLITPTITGTDAILYQTGDINEIEAIKERYESMLWEVEIKESNGNPSN